MNTNILQKCVEELKKETPNISYVLGMLETVIEMNGASLTPFTPSYVPTYYPPSSTGPSAVYAGISPSMTGGSGLVGTISDEDRLAQIYAGGPVGNVQ